MAKKEELKKLLADKYDKKQEDLEDTTLISEIVGSDKNSRPTLKTNLK